MIVALGILGSIVLLLFLERFWLRPKLGVWLVNLIIEVFDLGYFESRTGCFKVSLKGDYTNLLKPPTVGYVDTLMKYYASPKQLMRWEEIKKGNYIKFKPNSELKSNL